LAKSLMSIEGGDIANLMKGLEGIHEVKVELTVSVAGSGLDGSLDIIALAWVPTPEAHGTKDIASVAGTWPEREQRTLTAYIFALLYELDRAIGRAYAQKDITG